MMRPQLSHRRFARRLGTLVARFRRDDHGVYAVEFGLLAVPFFGILFAIIEVAWVSYNAERLQAVVNSAARQVMTGSAQGQYTTSAAFVANLLCPTNGTLSVPGSWDCSKLIVDVQTAANFASTNTANDFYTQTPKYCLGNPATIVVLRVTYPLPSYLPLSIYNRYVGLANDYPGVSGWAHVIMGSAVFKTEPYSGTTPAC